jgi:hypothetical protein
LVAFCLRHFLADFIICMCEFDFRQAQLLPLNLMHSESASNPGSPNLPGYAGKAKTGGRHYHCPLHSCSCHHGCREPVFRLAKRGLSQISGRRVFRVIGHFILSLSRRCFGAPAGDKFCRNTSDQRCPLHRPFHPLPALFLLWLR